MSLLTALVVLGSAVTLSYIVKFLYRVVPYFTPMLNLKLRYAKNRSDVWAVVTGASEGIGKEWAIQLSRQGFNIVLIARTVKKLEDAAKLLHPGVSHKILPLDFSQCDTPAFHDALMKGVKDIKIGVLINNAGVIDIERYHKITDKAIQSHIKVNMMSVTVMVMSLIKQMHESAKADQRKSIIVNMSSMSAENPLPYYQVYGASKAYVEYFSTAAEQSYALSGNKEVSKQVDFLTLRPYFIQTAMVNFKTKPMTITTEVFVESALRLFGKRSRGNGNVLHEINSFAMGLAPEFLTRMIAPKVSWNLVIDLGFKKED